LNGILAYVLAGASAAGLPERKLGLEKADPVFPIEGTLIKAEPATEK